MKDDAELIAKLFEDNIESVFGAPIKGPDNNNFVPPIWLFHAIKQGVDSNVDVPVAPLFKFDMRAGSVFRGIHWNGMDYKPTEELTDDERMAEFEAKLLWGNHQGAKQQLKGILDKKNFDAEHGFPAVVVCHATTHMDPMLQERFLREDSLLISNRWSVVWPFQNFYVSTRSECEEDESTQTPICHLDSQGST